MASATTPAAGTAVTSLRWLIALAGSPVRTSTVASARGTVEIGFIAARSRMGSPVLMPPSIPPARCRPEAVADLDSLDGLDAHQRAGQPAIQAPVPMDVAAKAGRQPVRDDLDDAAERVAVAVRRIDLGLHRRTRAGVQAPDRVGVDPVGVLRLWNVVLWRGNRAERDDVTQDLGADHLAQQVARDLAQCDPGRGLPRAGALQDCPGVVVAVLLPAGQVSVARPGSGERGIASLCCEYLVADWVGRHDTLPLGPLGVPDPDGDRAAQGHSVPDAAGDLDLVLLELHPRAAAVTRAA